MICHSPVQPDKILIETYSAREKIAADHLATTLYNAWHGTYSRRVDPQGLLEDSRQVLEALNAEERDIFLAIER